MRTYKMIRMDDPAELPRSAKYVGTDGVGKDLENGTFVALHGLIAGEREVYEAKDPVDGDTSVGVVCTPELEYDEIGYHGPETFINTKDALIRVALFVKGQRFSLTNTEYAKDQEITVGATKLKCIAIENAGRFKYAVLEVQ